MSAQHTIQRTWLYEQLWHRPATRVAAELGITSTALKKICVQMDIPTPAAGHWSKAEVGKAPPTPPLPSPSQNTKMSWTIDAANSVAQKSYRQRLQTAKETIEALPEVKISTDLENLHPLIKSTRAHLREDKRKISWDQRKNRRRLNCHVSEAMIDRASLILDSIVRAVEADGYEFRCELDDQNDHKRVSRHQTAYGHNEPSGVCWIQVGDYRVHLWLRERNKRVTLPEDKQRWYRNYDEVPSGLLECGVDDLYNYKGRIRWNDGKIQKIEKLIPLIVAEIPKIAAAKKAKHEEQERREKLRHYQDELRRFHDNRRSLNEEAFKGLLEDAIHFRSAQMAREYVEALKRRYGASSEPNTQSDVASWLDWVEQGITKLDPTANPIPPWEQQAFVDVLENAKEEPPERPSGI